METAIEILERRKKPTGILVLFFAVLLFWGGGKLSGMERFFDKPLDGAPAAGKAPAANPAPAVSISQAASQENSLFEDDWFAANEKLSPRERLEQPEVLEALFRGEPFPRVARLAGVPTKYLRQWMKRLPVERLMDMETRRLMAHMSTRKLSAEKYLALSTALCNLIDKIRLLRDEPTQILESRNTGKFERVAEAVRRRSLELRRGEGGDTAVFEYRGFREGG